MPWFTVTATRRVIEQAYVKVEAESEDQAEEIVEGMLANWKSFDFEWNMCDCQDDGSVAEVRLLRESL